MQSELRSYKDVSNQSKMASFFGPPCSELSKQWVVYYKIIVTYWTKLGWHSIGVTPLISPGGSILQWVSGWDL